MQLEWFSLFIQRNARVECSLAAHQFLLFRATLFKKVIEEKLLTTSSYTRNQYFFLLVVVSYISIILLDSLKFSRSGELLPADFFSLHMHIRRLSSSCTIAGRHLSRDWLPHRGIFQFDQSLLISSFQQMSTVRFKIFSLSSLIALSGRHGRKCDSVP